MNTVQCPLQMFLKSQLRQTFSKSFPLTVHDIKVSCVIIDLGQQDCIPDEKKSNKLFDKP